MARSFVSKNHAVLNIDSETNRCEIKDLGSASKTFLGVRKRQNALTPFLATTLSSGTIFFIADVQCIYRSIRDAAPELAGVEATATAAAVGAEAGGGVESVASANELKAMLSTKIDERETLKLQLADKRGGATELKKAKEIDKTISEIDVISGVIHNLSSSLHHILQDMYDENATELKKAKRKGLPTVTLTNRAGQLGLEIDQLLGLSPGNHNMKRRKSTSPQKLQRTSATFEVDMVLSSSSVGHIGGGGSAKPGKSFATSNFKKAYMKAKPILFQDELFSGTHVCASACLRVCVCVCVYGLTFPTFSQLCVHYFQNTAEFSQSHNLRALPSLLVCRPKRLNIRQRY